jgi:SRSO17 transposase
VFDAAVREELNRLHARIAPRFARQEVRERARRYLAALLELVDHPTGRQIAEHTGEKTDDGVQRLLNKARWDADAVRDDLRDYVVENLGDASGVLVLTEIGFPKKGPKSAGVARQPNPTTGRDENCQVGMFLAYWTPRGWACIDQALYLPQEWAEDEARRREAGVPEGVSFATKGELARKMLERAFDASVPAAWVTGGETYGTDKKLRRWLEARGRSYVLAAGRSSTLPRGQVPCCHRPRNGCGLALWAEQRAPMNGLAACGATKAMSGGRNGCSCATRWGQRTNTSTTGHTARGKQRYPGWCG